MRYEYIFSALENMDRVLRSMPTNMIKIEELRRHSYRLSALAEIEMMLDIDERKQMFRANGISCLEDLRKLFDKKSCEDGSEDKKLMFTVYYETVTDVLDTIYSMEV